MQNSKTIGHRRLTDRLLMQREHLPVAAMADDQSLARAAVVNGCISAEADAHEADSRGLLKNRNRTAAHFSG